MTFFLDTDICVAILRGKEPALESRLASIPLASVMISSVVAAELWVGVGKSSHPTRAEKKLSNLLRDLKVVPFDAQDAQKYGEVRARLEQNGVSIGGNDLLIAATTLVQGGRLITRNRRDYERIPGLAFELW